METPNPDPDNSLRFRIICDTVLVITWLLLLAVINRTTDITVSSIFPYLLPVIAVAMRYGLTGGFVCAACATLVAIPVGIDDVLKGNLYWFGLTAYFKLSVVAAGAWYGKKIVERRSS